MSQGAVLAGLSRPICKMSIPPLSADDSEAVEINDVEVVASYSWTDRSHPTILVPGSPPVWIDRSLPFKVEKDNFNAYVDQNGHRVPAYPLLPLVLAVQHMHPEFAFSNIDVVTDRNSLRKLLRWVRGREVDPNVKDFRMDVQLVGKTMLLTRREAKTMEYSNRAYGIGFERACTRSPPGQAIANQTGHHRVVQYNLEGLDLLVRFELDACLPSQAAKPAPDIGDLLARLDRMGVSGSDSSSASPGSPTTPKPVVVGSQPPKAKASSASPKQNLVDVISSGTLVPQSNTVELTTVSRKFAHNFSWPENFPQLYLSQTAHHFLGVHDFGKFATVQKRTLEELKNGAVGEAQQGDLKRLGKALHDIYNRVVEQEEGTLLCLACVGGVLRLYKRSDGKQALPEEVLALFLS